MSRCISMMSSMISRFIKIITISSNVIGALAALFFTNHSVEL